MIKNFSINGRKIGEKFKPLIVPEIGINHGGRLDVAIKIVDSAFNAGAEIIKHQTHIPEDEMSFEARKVFPGNSNENIFKIIKKNSLSMEDEFKLCQYVRRKKMIYLSTPFSRKAVDRLIKFKLDVFKIGSGEFNNFYLLDYVTKLKKKLILSTGMHDLKTIKKIYNYLKKKIDFCFMHTTSLYPTLIS